MPSSGSKPRTVSRPGAMYSNYGNRSSRKVCGDNFRHKALYNRLQHEIPLPAFTVAEAAELLRIESPSRVMDAYLAVGGIPEYLDWVPVGQLDHSAGLLSRD